MGVMGQTQGRPLLPVKYREHRVPVREEPEIRAVAKRPIDAAVTY